MILFAKKTNEFNSTSWRTIVYNRVKKIAIIQLLILNHHFLISGQLFVLEKTRVVPRPSNSNGHSFVDAIIPDGVMVKQLHSSRCGNTIWVRQNPSEDRIPLSGNTIMMGLPNKYETTIRRFACSSHVQVFLFQNRL